jgi:hypothetical protein
MAIGGNLKLANISASMIRSGVMELTVSATVVQIVEQQ